MQKILVIQQGDQYSIPLTLTFNAVAVTPSTADDVRVKIGDNLASYSDSTLAYDAEAQVWLFPLTESQTRALYGVASFQAGIKIGNDVYYSEVELVEIDESIITEGWTDE